MISSISHYRIIRPLGTGGMGDVYLAQDIRLDRSVAIKLLSTHLASDAKQLRRFLQEAKIAAALHHPNVCIIHEVGEAETGQPFIAMEYIEGQTLAAKINQQPLELSTLLTFAVQITDALEEAHAKGIIHRDLKPANILITHRNQVKVLDFGLAKLTAAAEAATVSEMPTQPKTESGTVMGTVPYMSPEQARGQEVDARSELFSFGIVLYEMATGRLPFVGTRTEILDRILHSQPEAIARFNYNAPVELERIIRKCLEKEKERRYQSATELLVDLQNLKRDTDSGRGSGKFNNTHGVKVQATAATEAKTEQTTPSEGRAGWLKALSWQGKVAIGLVLALLVGGLASALWWRPPAAASQPSIKSLAVLPLANLSGDPNQEYFADGMTESLISNLAQIRDLRVISRTSVMRYKGSDKSLPEIARELNVDAVIEGSVRREGGRVLVTAQLVPAATNALLWTRNYEREMADVLKLENEVARTVADEIRIQLTPEERRRLTSARSIDPQAQEAYLLGRYHLRNHNIDNLSLAIKDFERAIQIAPDYAAAYAGLADAHQFYAFKEGEAAARAAAFKAVEMDSDNAEAQTALAHVKFGYDWDWEGAEQGFKHSLDLDANNPNTHHYYAFLLMFLGRPSEAISEMQSAVQVDPFSSELQARYGWILYQARKYKEAIPPLQRALDLDPRNYEAYIRLGDVYAITGRYAEAISEYEKAAQLQSDRLHQARIARVYALMSRKREARQLVDKVKTGAFDLADAYVAIGDKDEAFKILEKAVEAHDLQLVFFKEDPSHDDLHSDPRWTALLRRMNFPLQ